MVPLLLPDAPVVAWWPCEAPDVPSEDPVGSVAGRRITDVGAAKSPSKALAQAAPALRAGRHRPGVEPHHRWRALLAAALDLPPYEKRDARGGERRARLGVGRPAGRLAGVPPRLPVTAHRPGTFRRVGRADRARSASSARSGSVELLRLDAKSAMLSQPGQPDRRVALSRRTTRECLAEELRRLDPDDIYAEAIEAMPTARGRSKASPSAKADA